MVRPLQGLVWRVTRRLGTIGALAMVGACSPSRPAPPSSPVATAAPAAAAPSPPPVTHLRLSRAQAVTSLCTLVAALDHDGDRRITVQDERAADCTPDGCLALPAKSPYPARLGPDTLPLVFTHQAAQLVTELARGLRRGEAHVELDTARVFENPVRYLRHRIEEHHFPNLTRRIDARPEHLMRALRDDKIGPSDSDIGDWCGPATRDADATLHATDANAPPDPPTQSAKAYHLYVPHDDPQALQVFAPARLPSGVSVHSLKSPVSPAAVTRMTREGEHGLLTLALQSDGQGKPFVVPGGRFNELYGWDSFFIAWGLLQAGDVALARSMVDNLVYEIEHYGKILNANRSYYLTRSQPPLLTSMIDEVWRKLTPSPTHRAWLRHSVQMAIEEYESVWSAAPRRTRLCEGPTCLSRYYGEGLGQPPEVEEGHFAWIYQQRALHSGLCQPPGPSDEQQAAFLQCSEALAENYRAGELQDRVLDAFFTHDRCVRESGHDTTYRWFHGDDQQSSSEHCADYATVDLNALLFKYELDLARLIETEFAGRLGNYDTAHFCARANARARLFQRELWDPERHLFFDYDLARGHRSDYVAATTLYPLWASTDSPCEVSLVSPLQAQQLTAAALAELEAPGGLLATSPRSLASVQTPQVWERTGGDIKRSNTNARQWEAPNGWAPHQMLAWSGLRRWGELATAERLTYKWLYTIARNAADYHGTVPEKFDVVRRSHQVFAEYGNVNTEFSYIAEEGFGWMNASFLVGLDALPTRLLEQLESLVPPERVAWGSPRADNGPQSRPLPASERGVSPSDGPSVRAGVHK